LRRSFMGTGNPAAPAGRISAAACA
jgi:hypothetical protein